MKTQPVITTLPDVAKSFSTFCKKCKQERYHKVLTHTSKTAAKVECEICHSKSTFRLASAIKPKKDPATKGPSKASRSHRVDWENLLAQHSSAGETYSSQNTYVANQRLEHKTFGPGVVIEAKPDRIDVSFESEVKTLIHNRRPS